MYIASHLRERRLLDAKVHVQQRRGYTSRNAISSLNEDYRSLLRGTKILMRNIFYDVISHLESSRISPRERSLVCSSLFYSCLQAFLAVVYSALPSSALSLSLFHLFSFRHHFLRAVTPLESSETGGSRFRGTAIIYVTA